MENQSQDSAVLNHIKKLTLREEELYGKVDLTADDIKELHRVKLELDQYWDLLRQRRALEDADRNPKRAEMRTVETIENYKK